MVERIREVQAQGAGAPAEHATDVRDKGVENADVDQVSDDREAVTAELGERHSEALGVWIAPQRIEYGRPAQAGCGAVITPQQSLQELTAASVCNPNIATKGNKHAKTVKCGSLVGGTDGGSRASPGLGRGRTARREDQTR